MRYLTSILTSLLVLVLLQCNKIEPSLNISLNQVSLDKNTYTIELINLGSKPIDLEEFFLKTDQGKKIKLPNKKLNKDEVISIQFKSNDLKSILFKEIKGTRQKRINFPLSKSSHKFTSKYWQHKKKELLFSHASGLYEDTFTFKFDTLQYKYFYTINGANPSHGKKYTNGIKIEKTKELKEIAFIPTSPLGGEKRVEEYKWKTPKKVYQGIIVLSVLAIDKNSLDSSYHYWHFKLSEEAKNISTISILTDPKNLFDHKTGIYVPGAIYDEQGWPSWWPSGNYSEKWEKPSNIALFDEDNQIQFQDNVGIRVNGYGICSFPQKTLRLSWKKKYGEKSLKYKLFDEDSIGRYKRLVLRNGGNDFVGSFIRDVFVQSLAPIGQITQNNKISEVYINGIFWGIHNIREKIDEHYIKSHFNLSPSEYDFYENCGEVIHESHNSYDTLIALVKNENIDKAFYYDRIANIIDVDHWVDYFLFHIYIGSFDWPGANIKFFKPHHGKWKWMIFDTDLSFGYHYIFHHSKGANFNTLKLATEEGGKEWPNPDCSTLFNRQMLKNPVIQEKIETRLNELLENEFQPRNVIHKLDSIVHIYQPHMPSHIERWSYPKNMDDWEEEIEYLKKFARKRPEYLKKQFQEYFLELK